jgi:hypothetical protein
MAIRAELAERFSARELEFLALYARTGLVKASAERAGISRSSAYKLISDPYAKQLIRDIRQEILDDVIQMDEERYAFGVELFERLRGLTFRLFDHLEQYFDSEEADVSTVVRFYEAVTRALSCVSSFLEASTRDRIFRELEEKIREYEQIIQGHPAFRVLPKEGEGFEA